MTSEKTVLGISVYAAIDGGRMLGGDEADWLACVMFGICLWTLYRVA